MFQDNLNKNSFKVELRNGNTKRDWSWAPSLLNKILKMILEDSFTDDFSDLTCSLTLIEFATTIAEIFAINDMTIKCKMSGIYKKGDVTLPKIPDKTIRWIKKLILVKNNEIYHLENWFIL